MIWWRFKCLSGFSSQCTSSSMLTLIGSLDIILTLPKILSSTVNASITKGLSRKVLWKTSYQNQMKQLSINISIGWIIRLIFCALMCVVCIFLILSLTIQKATLPSSPLKTVYKIKIIIKWMPTISLLQCHPRLFKNSAKACKARLWIGFFCLEF